MSAPSPSTSKQTTSQQKEKEVLPPNDDDDDIKLNINDEEAEIARLQLPSSPTTTTTKEKDDGELRAKKDEDERIAKIDFLCSACDMHEMVHYFGQSPPFVYGITFSEDTYVMRDPFAPPPPRWKPKAEYFVALGAQCGSCQRTICRDSACSFYYTRTYCLTCAADKVKQFPLEAQAKLRKQLAAK